MNNDSLTLARRKKTARLFDEKIKNEIDIKIVIAAKQSGDAVISDMKTLPELGMATMEELLILRTFAVRYNDPKHIEATGVPYDLYDAVADVATTLEIEKSTIWAAFTRRLNAGDVATTFEQIQNTVLFDDEPFKSDLAKALLNDIESPVDKQRAKEHLKTSIFIARKGDRERCKNIL